MADAGTPDWWLDRLYKRLNERRPLIQEWDKWYTGEHPAPEGYEGAEALFQRVLDAVGLNMLAVVSDAPMPRMKISGFKVNGTVNDDIWDIWQANNFDRGSKLVRQDKHALSEAYVLVDPNGGDVRLTPEHPEQCIVEYAPGSSRDRAAGLKVWLDDIGETPEVHAVVYLPRGVFHYAAPTRVFTQRRTMLALRPNWELQGASSGPNPLGEVPLVPFPNRGRMMNDPLPEFHAAIRPQKRINKTLLDRMAMQDQGAFKAMWATGCRSRGIPPPESRSRTTSRPSTGCSSTRTPTASSGNSRLRTSSRCSTPSAMTWSTARSWCRRRPTRSSASWSTSPLMVSSSPSPPR
jgi:hypothetical protein